ncbi:MAG: response regulator [Candidatus Latescibacterota bacterium]
MAKAKILVVEDEGIVGLDIQSKLRRWGYEVPAPVGTGEEAVQRAAELRPDLVLMDIQLGGGMDGVEAAARIRSEVGVPVIYLTAYSDDTTLGRAKNAEPSGYILKPLEERSLYAAIEVALHNHQIDQEKGRLAAQLSQVRTMEAIGRLSSSLAGRFASFLHGVQGNLYLALARAPDRIRPYLDAAEYDAQQAAQLLHQLELLYRQEEAERRPVDVGSLVADVAATCRQVLGRRHPGLIQVETDCAAVLPPIQGHPEQLRQCLAALCARAGEALGAVETGSQPHPRLLLSAALAGPADSPALARQAGAGPHLRVRVTDNGPGLDAQTREHVFEPFIDTQDPRRSTGLGLAAAYAIACGHGGWIECASQPESGTTFTIYLPVCPPASAETPQRAAADVLEPEAPAPAGSVRGGQRVLVIADVERYRGILCEMLQKNGYEVLVALDVRDGLGIFGVEKDSLALTILDLSEPGARAGEVAERLAAMDAGAAILLVTGYPARVPDWPGVRRVLHKPFREQQLLRAVRQAART